MLELLSIVLYGWLLIVVGKWLFKVAWCMTKIVAGILFFLSIPTLIGCLVVARGLALLLPVGLLVFAIILLAGRV